MKEHQYLINDTTEVFDLWNPIGTSEIKTTLNKKSKFEDETWDLSALPGLGSWRKKLHFYKFKKLGLNEFNIIETKKIFFILLHNQGENLPATNSFLSKYYAIKNFAIESSKEKLSIFEAISDLNFGIKFIQNKPNAAIEFYSIFTKFIDLPFQFPINQLKPFLNEANLKIRQSELQTAVIPSRIYSIILNNLSKELEYVEKVCDELIEFLSNANTSTRGNYPDISIQLKEYAAKIGQGEIYRLSNIAGWISNVYAVCGTIIAAYSGMRRNEVNNLRLNALSSFEHNGTVHHCIQGYTTKFNSGRAKPAQWVTNNLGFRAINVALKIAMKLYELNGYNISKIKGKNDFLLFPRHGFGSYGEFNASNFQDANIPRDNLFYRITTVISNEDIKELEQIDINRNWRKEEKFKINKKWPLSLHQFRRSLAIYAHRSGIVTLPSLKAQLQHITLEMSMYYSKGSVFAKTMVFEQEHFAHEWNAGMNLSKYLGYTMNVLLSDEKLFGGAATWAHSSAVKSSPVSVYSREHAIKMFEKGEIGYQETVLGACTSTQRCDSLPLNPIPFDCLETNCRNLVVSPKKLDKVIQSQTNFVQQLEQERPNSVELRLEKQGLNILNSVRLKMETKNEK